MSFSDIQVKVTYDQIGDTHLLIHAHCPGFVDHWILIDLEELAKKHGKSVDVLLVNLMKNLQKQEGEL